MNTAYENSVWYPIYLTDSQACCIFFLKLSENYFYYSSWKITEVSYLEQNFIMRLTGNLQCWELPISRQRLP